MSGASLQHRVLTIALLPAALLAVVLSAYNAHQRIQAAEAATLEHARVLARQLAPIAARELERTGEPAVLDDLARRVVAGENAITGVAIRRRDGTVLLDRGVSDADDANTTDTRAVSLAIRPAPDMATPGSPGGHSGASLGRISVEVDLGIVRRGRIAGLVRDLGITGLTLALTAFVALRIGRGITDPVRDLVRGVERIRNGEYDYRPPANTGGELGQLERGISELAATIEGTQRAQEERIEEATRELQDALAELEERNAELESARSEAEAASEFKSRFLANISHEIRTPMNSILGFTELLARADLDPVHVDYLVTIQNSAQSLLGLLNGILDLSKIESGRMELEYADTDVNELLFETFHMLVPQAFSRGVEFIVVPAPPRLSNVRVDAVRLKQVLINLASNAVKFTDRGYVRIAAQVISRADGGVGLTFTFTDTGRGIPHDAQARLFQAFAQGEHLRADTRIRPAGTGLGLHIASEIVFLMDGLIEFRSEPGAGSEFWFRLELDRADTADQAPLTCRGRRTVVLTGTDAVTGPALRAVLAGAGIDVAEPDDDGLPPGVDSPAPDAILAHIPADRLREGRCPPPDAALRAARLPILAHTYTQSPEIRDRLIAAGYTEIVQNTPEPGALRASFERALAETGWSDPPPRVTAHAPEPEHDAREYSVLVVDDQPMNLKLLESFLEGTAWHTVAATGSDEALYHARLQRFDIILMDVHLPERDGVETTRILRTPGELNADTPIIAVTADAFADQAHAAMAAGMNDVLVKPVSRQALLERLHEWSSDDGPEERDGAGGADTGAMDGGEKNGTVPLIDEEDGKARAGGRNDVADELFGMLLNHLPGSRDELRAAGESGDVTAQLGAAHRLKGAAAYCGVPRLRADVAAFEEAARHGDDRQRRARLDALCATIEALLETTGGADTG